MAGTKNLGAPLVDRLQDQQQSQYATKLNSLPGVTAKVRQGRAMSQGGVRTDTGDIAGAPPRTERVVNPPFLLHSAGTRGRPQHYRRAQKIHRGFIQKDPIHGDELSQKIRLNFMYNPFSINFHYATDPTVLPDEYSPESQEGVGRLVQGASFALDLLFDRVGEVSRNILPDGVLTDIDILDKVTGIDQNGVVTSNPVKLRLGPRWYMYGFMTEVDVLYTLFSAKMVPMRAKVSLGFVAQYRSENPLGNWSAGTANNNPGAPASGTNWTS